MKKRSWKNRSWYRWFRKRSMVNAAPYRCGLSETVRSFLHDLPKSEIHIHIEGCLEPEILFALAKKYRDPDIQTLNDACWALYFSQPREFFLQFLYASSFLREPDDFYFLALETGKRLRTENVRYVEFTFAPHKFVRSGRPYIQLIESIDRGLCEAYRGMEFDYGIVIDIVRDLGPKHGMEMVRIVEDNPHPRVVGIGLGGGENYPPEDSAHVFDYAETLGLRRSAHAGEGRGAASIWGAIHSLKAERIDHGLRSYEDDHLLDYLVQHRMPLNMCLSSNVHLGVCASYREHPFRRYFEMGIPVNLSTDDPAFFRTTMTQELEKLVEYLSFPVEKIPDLMRHSLQASFLPDERKRYWMETFEKQSSALLDEIHCNFPGQALGHPSK